MIDFVASLPASDRIEITKATFETAMSMAIVCAEMAACRMQPFWQKSKRQPDRRLISRPDHA